VHPDLRSSSTTLPFLHLAAHKPRGPGFAASAVDASLRLNHKAAIALTAGLAGAIAQEWVRQGCFKQDSILF
jgi:hypothetical protein